LGYLEAYDYYGMAEIAYSNILFHKKHYSDSELLVNSEAEIAKPKQKAGKKAAAK
jgi:hypothetical protein